MHVKEGGRRRDLRVGRPTLIALPTQIATGTAIRHHSGLLPAPIRGVRDPAGIRKPRPSGARTSNATPVFQKTRGAPRHRDLAAVVRSRHRAYDASAVRRFSLVALQAAAARQSIRLLTQIVALQAAGAKVTTALYPRSSGLVHAQSDASCGLYPTHRHPQKLRCRRNSDRRVARAHGSSL